jgi:hypothetical protein
LQIIHNIWTVIVFYFLTLQPDLNNYQDEKDIVVNAADGVIHCCAG